jgi:hypothetical protein
MTKKLFVVLVVVAFMLTSFSWVFGATAPSSDVEKVTRPVGTPPNKADLKQLDVVNTRPNPSSTTLSGTLNEIRFQPKKLDVCDLALPGGYWYWSAWLYGNEEYAAYQAPENYGCTSVYSFDVEDVTILLFTSGPITLNLQPKVYDNAGGPYCPTPGALICEGPIYEVVIEDEGGWILTLPLTSDCCVNCAYFAAVDIITPGLLDIVYPVTTQTPEDPVLCYSYNDYGTGWVDMGAAGFSGYLAVWSSGYTHPQNTCPPVLPNCQLQIDQANFWRVPTPTPNGFVNFFDPIWCGASPTYPFAIDSVEFRVSLGNNQYPINVKIAFFDLFTCGDSCSGPGREIYSEIVTLPAPWGNDGWFRIPLSRRVCVWRPFFGGIFNADTTTGWMMQPNFSEETEDTCRSFGFWDGYWYNWAQFWGYPTGIGNVVFRAIGHTNYESCPQELTCDTLKYHHASQYALLRCPEGRYGKERPYAATKFTAPAAGQLKMVRAQFKNRVPGVPADVWFYVWKSDGKYPTTKIDSVHFGDPDTNVFTWHAVDFSSKNIFFYDGERFHVGLSSANYVSPQTNNIQIYVDSLTGKGTDNSSQYFAYTFGTSPFWMTLNDNNEYYGLKVGTEFFIQAELCYTQLDYKMVVTPPGPSCHAHAWAQAAVGSPATYNLDFVPIQGYPYALNLSVSGVPPGALASFNPPNGTPPFSSVLTVDVDGTVAYDMYLLTVSASGPKGVSTRDVELQVIPVGTYTEFWPLEAANCSTRVTNFGALGNPDVNGGLSNFVWYNASPLFDGGIILASGPDKIACDIAASDGPEKWFNGPSIFPIGSQTITQLPDYPEVYMTEGHWADAIGLRLFGDEYTVGIVDPSGGGDFSIHAYNITNAGDPETIYMGVFNDDDIWNNAKNRGGYDSLHNMGWLYDRTLNRKDTTFGWMRAPMDDSLSVGYKLTFQPHTIWHVSASGVYHPDLWNWLTAGTWDTTVTAVGDSDWSYFFFPTKFTLGTGESRHEVLLEYGKKNSEDNHIWRHRVLRYAGFYRGDVNASDYWEAPAIDLSDCVYLRNYIYLDGAEPLPFADQGDVNANGEVDLGDMVYVYRYVYRGGPPPWDYIRFIPEVWKRPSLFLSPNWQ